MNKWIWISGLLMFTACQEVIHVDLNSAAPLTVIEGKIRAGESCVVSVSRTTDFFSPAPPTPVTDALVELSDDQGNTEMLSIVLATGNYQSTLITGEVGRRYTLRVTSAGRQYVAQSTMESPVPLDSIYFLPQNVNNLSRGYITYSKFVDPPAAGNYYYFSLRLDTAVIDPRRYITFSDRLNNGEPITFRTGGHRFKAGEPVTVRMYSIDKAVFDYYNTLERTLSVGGGGAQQSAPGNPTSNFTNGALGYFGAFGYTERTAVVK